MLRAGYSGPCSSDMAVSPTAVYTETLKARASISVTISVISNSCRIVVSVMTYLLGGSAVKIFSIRRARRQMFLGSPYPSRPNDTPAYWKNVPDHARFLMTTNRCFQDRFPRNWQEASILFDIIHYGEHRFYRSQECHNLPNLQSAQSALNTFHIAVQ